MSNRNSVAQEPQSRTLIVGGGITGLSAAYELVRLGRPAVLIEQQAQLGGVIQTETVDGCVLEQGPDSFLTAKPAAAELIRELGLGGEIIASNDHGRVTYVVRKGRLVPLPDGLMMMVPTRIMPVAASPLLGWATKARMGLEYFHKPPDAHRERSVGEFIRQHYGSETVDYLAEPLLSGVYGGDVERLSVDSVLTRFVEIEAKYGSLTKGVLAARKAAAGREKAAPLFQTMKGGLAQLTAELERRITPACQVVRHRAEAAERTSDGRWRVRAGGEWIGGADLIFACPAYAAGALLNTVNSQIAALLSGIEYSSSMTVALVYRQDRIPALPPGFGFLVPARERGVLVACTFTGAKFPHRVPDTHAVLRCFLGGAGNEAVLDSSDGDILSSVLDELHALLGWRVEPDRTRITRWRRAMAQYTVGHETRMRLIDDIRSTLPGLHLAGNAYSGIGIPDCIRTGRAAARAAAAR
ncbi:MAG: protoporphyrinogen oxidase [Candidatus Solibacter sp.]|nr:protoporphyrinogen oxidase [Candidatus Solibacter sp.]